ncbi:MAG: hypothetical protein IT432_10670 [Phycisphaerales bacterium]|nr:hypothetical protein [Phycisphaerales bacterium]
MKLVSRSSMMAVGALLSVAGQAIAADWTVTLLEPAGAGQSKCFGAYGGVQCGYANFGMQGEALLWGGSSTSYYNMSTGMGWTSAAANAISGDQVVISATVGMGRGYLFKMSDASYTDLTGTNSSVGMQGVNGATNTQVGSGMGSMMMGIMMMWHGTPGSAVDLTPPGWISAASVGCSSTYQIGNGMTSFMGFGHPFLTYGTSASYVDLTPPGATSAAVAGCDESNQVGGVLWPSAMMGHACMWSGTAASVVDLHPADAASSSAVACAEGIQVGNYVPSTGGYGKARYWSGSAASGEDLHHYVTEQIGSQYIQTEVTGIDPITFDVVGIAYTTDGMFMIPHAIMWSPATTYCPADFNQDGFVNALDYDGFASLFEVADPGADFNNDGFVNALDYDEFASHFEAGC